MANYYDFETIDRDIPIEDVLAFHGIYPDSKGNYRLRPEDDTPSAKIHRDRKYGNKIHDFGDTGAKSNTFAPISLTMYLQGVDEVEASRILGDAFGITPIKKDKTQADVITDWEWEKINVHPDMASKNMEFSPEKYGLERTKAYAEKYRIPMSELKKEDIKMYERILRSRAIPYILDLKNSYYSRLYDWDAFNKKCNLNPSLDGLFNDKEINNLAKNLSVAESILKKAIKDTSITFKTGVYNVKTDFYKVINGEISFEIGKDSHYDIKCAAFQDRVKVFYCLVSLDEYYKLMENGLENMHVAAFQKGDEVNLSFISTDSNRINYLVRALRGKETNIEKALVQDNGDKTKENDKDVVIDTESNNNKKQTFTSRSQDDKQDVVMDIN